MLLMNSYEFLHDPARNCRTLKHHAATFTCFCRIHVGHFERDFKHVLTGFKLEKRIADPYLHSRISTDELDHKDDMLSRWLRPCRAEIWQGAYTTIKQTVSRLNYVLTHHNLSIILSLCESPN